MVWVADIQKQRDSDANPENLLLGKLIVRTLESSMLDGQYLFVIDARCCGTFNNAQYLHSKGRQFLISVVKNQPSWLFSKFLHQGN